MYKSNAYTKNFMQGPEALIKLFKICMGSTLILRKTFIKFDRNRALILPNLGRICPLLETKKNPRYECIFIFPINR